ncbi:MAG: tyrosine-type recombinase/integrase [Methylocystis sp.]|uniref:tyrosine-type recombinase/integrase n=1 Tax=Methylocystis sp. TaxID=1911079 RepID=UPI003DA4FF03
MPKLTVKAVEAILRRAAAGESVKEFTGDGAGLYLRVRASGAASYWLRQSGFPPLKVCDADIGLAEARRLSLEARAQRARGVDPAAERKRGRAEARAAAEEARVAAKVAALGPDNVASLYDAYERRQLRPKKRSAHAENLVMRRRVIPAWGDLPIKAITRAMVAKLVHDLSDEAPRAADLLLSYVSGFFRWAEGMGHIDENPAARIPRPATNDARERVLSNAELRLIWLACDRLEWPTGPVIKLLMLSGQRKSEIGDGRWSEVDLASRTWTLPKARVKNQSEHTFPLSRPAIAILQGLPRVDGEDRIFAGPKGGASWGGTRAKSRLDEIVTELNGGEAIPHWQLHDLRRTAATGWGNLGVAPHVVECLLNHVGGFRGGVAGVYNKSRYWPEMVDAMDRWAAHLKVIVAGDNVVSLPARKGA